MVVLSPWSQAELEQRSVHEQDWGALHQWQGRDTPFWIISRVLWGDCGEAGPGFDWSLFLGPRPSDQKLDCNCTVFLDWVGRQPMGTAVAVVALMIYQYKYTPQSWTMANNSQCKWSCSCSCGTFSLSFGTFGSRLVTQLYAVCGLYCVDLEIETVYEMKQQMHKLATRNQTMHLQLQLQLESIRRSCSWSQCLGFLGREVPLS